MQNADLQLIESELKRLYKIVDSELATIRKIIGEEKLTHISDTENHLYQIQQYYNTICLELQSCSDKDRKDYEEVANTIQKKLGQYKSLIKLEKQNTIKINTIDAEPNDKKNENNNYLDYYEKKGDALLQQTQNVASNISYLIDDSEKQVISGGRKIDEQIEKIMGIDNKLSNVESSSKRANETFKDVLKSATSDPCIKYLCIANIVAIIIIIIINLV